LRKAAEGVLQEGETISSFVEQSLRANIERRQMQQEFIARGLAAREDARETGEYYSADEVLQELDDLLDRAKKKARK